MISSCQTLMHKMRIMRKIFLIIILAVSSFSVFAQQKSGIKTKADALAFMRYFVSYTSKGLPLSLYGQRLWYKTTLESTGRTNYYYVDGKEIDQVFKDGYQDSIYSYFLTKDDLYNILELTFKNIDVVQEMEVYKKIPDLRQAQKILNLPTKCLYLDKNSRKLIYSFTFMPKDVFFVEKAYSKVKSIDFIESLYAKIYGFRIGTKLALKSFPRKITDKITLISGTTDNESINYSYLVEDEYLKSVNLQVLKAIAFTQKDFLKECKLLNLDKQDVANTLKLLEIYDYKLNFSFKGKSNNNIEKHFQISANDISAYLNR